MLIRQALQDKGSYNAAALGKDCTVAPRRLTRTTATARMRPGRIASDSNSTRAAPPTCPPSHSWLLVVFVAILTDAAHCGHSSSRARQPPSDVQYLMTQNFLTDLPMRAQGPFAAEVEDAVRTTRFQDYSSYKASSCFDGHLLVTTDTNSPQYFNTRRVGVGAQSASIGAKSAAPGSVGSLTLTTVVTFEAQAHVKMWCHWWWPFPPFPVDTTECDGVVGVTGTATTVVAVDIIDKSLPGAAGAGGHAGFDFRAEPTVTFPAMVVKGCEGQGWFSKWLVGLITDQLAAAIKKRVAAYVVQQARTISVDQPVKVNDKITMYYHVNHMKVEPADSISVHASVRVEAITPSGDVRTFALHRSTPVPDTYVRFDEEAAQPDDDGPAAGKPPPGGGAGGGSRQLALLSGMRFSPEVMTNVFRAMHASGYLQPVVKMQVRERCVGDA